MAEGPPARALAPATRATPTRHGASSWHNKASSTLFVMHGRVYPSPSSACQGFVAKPRNKADGSQDVMFWECTIPGKAGVRRQHRPTAADCVFGLCVLAPALARLTRAACSWTQTIWEGGMYKLTMEFTEEYPSKPPK